MFSSYLLSLSDDDAAHGLNGNLNLSILRHLQLLLHRCGQLQGVFLSLLALLQRLVGEAGQGALGAGHPPAGLAFSADGSAPVRQRQKMNNIRNAAMEIVSTDSIYA